MGMRYSYLVYPAATASLPWARTAVGAATTSNNGAKTIRDMSLCLGRGGRGHCTSGPGGDWHSECSNGVRHTRAAGVTFGLARIPGGTHMPLLSKPAFGPRTSIVYITLGSLIDVWTVV